MLGSVRHPLGTSDFSSFLLQAQASRAQVVAGALVAGDLSLRAWALAAVPRDRRPSSALAWLLAVNLIPYAGPLAFAVIGFLTWHGLPGNLPSCTGAARPALLGTLTPGREPLAIPVPVGRSPRRLVVLPGG